MTAKLHLLGPPSLVTDGRVARMHSAKILALLAYLILEAGGRHSREKLATLFWGESPDAQARASLRQGLYSLRQTLGNLADICLVQEEGAVGFRPHQDFWVDALEFQTLMVADTADLDMLRQAAQLYRGSLLEGLMLSDCPAFEEWLFFCRDTLEQQALQTYHTLAERLIRHGAPPGGSPLCPATGDPGTITRKGVPAADADSRGFGGSRWDAAPVSPVRRGPGSRDGSEAFARNPGTLSRAHRCKSGDALPQQSLDFYHDYFRRVIYEGLGAVQRQALHRRAAEALLALYRAKPQVVIEEVAYHFEVAADGQAVTYLVRAAQQAEELLAYAHATELYSRALAAHRTYLDDELAGQFELLLAREAVLDRQGRRAEQANDVAALVAVAETLLGWPLPINAR